MFLATHGVLSRTSAFVPPVFANNYSIELDGLSDYVDCGNDSSFNLTTEMTLSAWVKPSVIPSDDFVIAKRQTSDSYQMAFNSVGKASASIWIGSTRYNVFSTTTISANNWFNIVVTFNGSNLKIYVNSVLEGNTSVSGTIKQTTDVVTLASGLNSNAYNFNGNIDEVAIFNSELSISDVTSIYNSGVPNDISSLSPVSWWRCGDLDTAPILTDNGSGGNDGTMQNFTTFSTDVPFNYKSIELDGLSDYVDCGTASFSSLSALTISAWVKPSAYGSSSAESFVSTDASSPRGFYFGLYTNSNFRFSMSTNGANLNSLDTAGLTVDLNAWQHVLVTWDKVNTKFYKNGVLITTKATTFANNQDFTTTNDLLIGARRSSAGFFEGNIDEVSIYNVALTQSDVTTIWNNGVPSDISSINGLTNLWRCGDGDTAPTLTDNIGSNNGTMTNFTTFSTDVP